MTPRLEGMPLYTNLDRIERGLPAQNIVPGDVGGPARYLAHTVGRSVTALELQSALHDIGADLIRRSGLGDRVTHVRGDTLTHDFPDASFDAVVSFLAIVHIPERPRLSARLARALAPGGGGYIEDLCQRAPFAPTVHGEGAYRAQELFYSVIARLYESGSLGGVRLLARRA